MRQKKQFVQDSFCQFCREKGDLELIHIAVPDKPLPVSVYLCENCQELPFERKEFIPISQQKKIIKWEDPKNMLNPVTMKLSNKSIHRIKKIIAFSQKNDIDKFESKIAFPLLKDYRMQYNEFIKLLNILINGNILQRGRKSKNFYYKIIPCNNIEFMTKLTKIHPRIYFYFLIRQANYFKTLLCNGYEEKDLQAKFGLPVDYIESIIKFSNLPKKMIDTIINNNVSSKTVIKVIENNIKRNCFKEFKNIIIGLEKYNNKKN